MSHPHKLEKVSALVEVGGEDKQDAGNSRNESIQVKSLKAECFWTNGFLRWSWKMGQGYLQLIHLCNRVDIKGIN